MSFDFSTLITDRTQADVTKKAAKGFYNASDLNRVTACMEYLDEELRKLGYESGYQRVRIERPEPPPTSRLPEGYTELEYIESTGTQYIDTGISAPKGFFIECDVSLTSISNNLNMLFGSHDKNPPYYRNYLSAMNSGSWQIGAYDPKEFGRATINEKCHIEVCTISGAISCSINGSDQGLDPNMASTVARSALPIYVFALNYADGLLPAKMKLHGLTLYLSPDRTNKTGEYAPCVSPSGAVGLYDLVGKKFYGNAGTGTFSAGPEIIPETPPVPEPEPLDPYLWYDTDAPTATQMAQYLANVAALRAVFTLPEGTPQTPQSMALLTFEKANDIESVLQYVETTIQQTVKGMARSNSFTFWSGNRPFPTAESNKGRDWAGLDAMGTGWRNWQVATWYLLLYGNLKEEGDVV